MRTSRDKFLKRGRWLLLVLAVFFGVQFYQARHVPKVAPDFEGVLSTGDILNFAEFQKTRQGQPLVLYFWATWCPLCKHMAVNMDNFTKEVDVLTIASQSGSPIDVQELLQSKRYQWTTVADVDGSIQGDFGLHSVPAVVFIGADGKIHATSIGYTTELGLKARLWWTKWRSQA